MKNGPVVRRAVGGVKRFTVCGLLVATWLPVRIAQGADDFNAKIEARGLRIIGAGYGEDGELRAMNWHQGVTVSLMLLAPNGGLIGFDAGESKVESLTDDKGTDLYVEEGFSTKGFSMFSSISADGKAMIVDLEGGGVPAKGAKAIRAKGSLTVLAAKKNEAHQSKAVAVKEGTKVEAGGLSFEMTQVGQPSWGEMPLSIDLKIDDDPGTIKGFRFLDGDGKEIESQAGGMMSMEMFGKKQVTYSFDLAKKVEQLTVEVTVWTDMEKRTVPLDLEVSVGL